MIYKLFNTKHDPSIKNKISIRIPIPNPTSIKVTEYIIFIPKLIKNQEIFCNITSIDSKVDTRVVCFEKLNNLKSIPDLIIDKSLGMQLEMVLWNAAVRDLLAQLDVDVHVTPT